MELARRRASDFIALCQKLAKKLFKNFDYRAQCGEPSWVASRFPEMLDERS